MGDLERLTFRPVQVDPHPGDTAEPLATLDAYHLINAAIAPRPGARVSTH